MYGDHKVVKSMMPAFERRFFDLRSDIYDVNLVSTFAQYFGIIRYQSDSFWDFASELIYQSFGSLTLDEKLDTMRAFANARRGSDVLWSSMLNSTVTDKISDPIAAKAGVLRFALEVEFNMNTTQLRQYFNMKGLIADIQQVAVSTALR